MPLTPDESNKILAQQREFAKQIQKIDFTPILEQQREFAKQVQKIGFASILEQQRDFAKLIQKIDLTPILEQQREFAEQVQKIGFASILEQQREFAKQIQTIDLTPILEQQREFARQVQKIGVSPMLRSIALDLPRLATVGMPVPAPTNWNDVPDDEVAELVLLDVWMWFGALTPAERRAVRNGLGGLVLAGAYLMYVVTSTPTKGDVLFASAAFWFAVVLLASAIQDTRD